MKETILITGGAGFIGSHLSEMFVGQGHQVIVIDNFFRGKKENIEHLIENGDVILYEYDLKEYESIDHVKSVIDEHRPSKILHYAAINGTQYFYDIPQEVAEVNSIATLYLLKALKGACTENKDYKPLFVFASTSETYGEPFKIPTTEKNVTYFRIEEDRDSYAVAKMMSEFYVKLYSKQLELNWIILRIFNVYGPRMIGTKYGQVIPEFVSRLKGGEYPLNILGDGSHTRSFIHISDHVELTKRLLYSDKLKYNEVYNLGNDVETSILELASKTMELMDLEPKCNFKPERSGDHLRRVPDISKLIGVVGEFEFIPLEAGLTQLLD